MVASQHEEVFRMFDLVGEKKAHALNGLFSSIDVIPQEEVVSVAGESSVFEKLD